MDLCELEEIGTDDGCKKRGSFKTAFWAKLADIDLVAMAAAPTSWDSTTEKILSYIMVGSGVFTRLRTEKKTSRYSFAYTEDNDFYENLINIQFEGKSSSRRVSLKKAIYCCKIVVHIFDNNGEERVVGIVWNGVELEEPLKPTRIARHLDDSGDFSGTKPRDEVDIAGESLDAPLFAEVGMANIPV